MKEGGAKAEKRAFQANW